MKLLHTQHLTIAPNENENIDELQKTMADALFEMQRLVDDELAEKENFIRY